MSYERIDRIDGTRGVDRMTGVVPLGRVARRENPAEDQQDKQDRSRQEEREPQQDDGRPHIDVTV